MNKIIQEFINNSHSEDVLQELYGISSKEHFDCVFVAPSWPIAKIFGTGQDNISELYQDRFSKSFKIKNGSKTYLYIQLQVGAPNIADFCLSCYRLNCDKYVFIGSAGSLVPEINIGDIVIPETAISGTGATLYLHEQLDKENLFEKTHSSPELNTVLRNICNDLELTVKQAVPISVDSIFCEYQHLDEFRSMGARLIEMECATFFKAIKMIEKQASAILLVSDNSASGQHLVGQSQELRTKYHSVRSQLQNILLSI